MSARHSARQNTSACAGVTAVLQTDAAVRTCIAQEVLTRTDGASIVASRPELPATDCVLVQNAEQRPAVLRAARQLV